MFDACRRDIFTTTLRLVFSPSSPLVLVFVRSVFQRSVVLAEYFPAFFLSPRHTETLVMHNVPTGARITFHDAVYFLVRPEFPSKPQVFG